MESKYIYSIAIVVVLLVLLFMYNVMKGAPATNTNSNPSGKPGPKPKPDVKTAPGATSLQIMCNNISSTPYSFTISITDSNNKTVSNTITSSSASVPSVWDDFNIITLDKLGLNLPIGGIIYDGSNYVNFYKYLNPSTSTTNASRVAVATMPSYINSIVDTGAQAKIIYDTTTGSVLNDTLTFTAGNNTLTIKFNSSFQ